MLLQNDAAAILGQLQQPAFLVKNGIIQQINIAAAQLHITPQTPVLPMLASGHEEYAEFSQGKLSLSMYVNDILCNGSVVRLSSGDIFCLELDNSSPELRAHSLASQALREPLSRAMLHAESLLETADPDQRDCILSLKKSLHQLHRSVCNMSDAACSKNGMLAKLENRDIGAFLAELADKTRTMTESTGSVLKYTRPQRPAYCVINAMLLERGVLNLLSNAFKYGDADAPVTLEVLSKGERLCICVSNGIDSDSPGEYKNYFDRYLQSPATRSCNAGIGLGITIARNAAIAHSGTLMLDWPEKNTVRFTMSIPLKQPEKCCLRCPLDMPMDYSGGYDHLLTELSDILPDQYYE